MTSDDTLVVRADEAVEEGARRAIHFAGHVEIHAPTWSASGERATLHGDPEDPRLIVMEGAPAMVKVLRRKDGTLVEARGRYLEFWRDRNAVRLRDQAVVEDGERIIRGDTMTYSIETKRYSATGKGRVRATAVP